MIILSRPDSFVRAGYLLKKVEGKGWHVQFPELREVCFFSTQEPAKMIVYGPVSDDDLQPPHIFAHLADVMSKQGPGGRGVAVAWSRE